MSSLGWSRMACWILSRRDYRTQPGVLTPGNDQKTVRPEGAKENPFRVSSSLHSLLATPPYRPVRAGPLWVGYPGFKTPG
jgi:hypothetical protein